MRWHASLYAYSKMHSTVSTAAIYTSLEKNMSKARKECEFPKHMLHNSCKTSHH